MVTTLSKTFGNLNKMAAIFLDFQCFGFGMAGTIAMAIAMTNHSKIEPLEIQTSKLSVFQYIFYSMSSIQAPTLIQFFFLFFTDLDPSSSYLCASRTPGKNVFKNLFQLHNIQNRLSRCSTARGVLF